MAQWEEKLDAFRRGRERIEADIAEIEKIGKKLRKRRKKNIQVNGTTYGSKQMRTYKLAFQKVQHEKVKLEITPIYESRMYKTDS